jgi:hypothetical protein
VENVSDRDVEKVLADLKGIANATPITVVLN